MNTNLSLSETQVLTTLLDDLPSGIGYGQATVEIFIQWLARTNSTVSRVFGDDSDQFNEFTQITVVHRGGGEWSDLSSRQVATMLGDLHAFLALEIAKVGLLDRFTDDSSDPREPRIFIAHGGKSGSRDKLERFIRSMDCDPVIVEERAGSGGSPGSKVSRQLRSCDFAVVLATSERGAIQDKETQPRLNVMEEIGRISEIFEHSRILLLENGLSLPSNASDWTWTSFSEEAMDEAFIAIATELTDIGLMRAGVMDDEIDE